ncbi:unnamed protein product [Caenorhabditis sp. 36 PRJEB53466]|nr:unnamed protein product [Caenorhabditis sp. 36 PRJEB53466]
MKPFWYVGSQAGNSSNSNSSSSTSTSEPTEMVIPPIEIGLPNYIPPKPVEDNFGFRLNGKPFIVGDMSPDSYEIIISILLKATTLLPQVKAEGVRLRLKHLDKQLRDKILTNGVVLALKELVYALDRKDYILAWKHFEFAQKNYPNEIDQRWSAGIRLLILELKPRQRQTSSDFQS